MAIREIEHQTTCPTCGGQGGTGDERCAIIICPDCQGTGVAPPPPRPRAGAAPRPRAEAQWAKGQFEPQNPAERVKRDQDGLDVAERIIGLHAREGFGSISPQDLNVRYRWYGLYTQRPEEDGYFMMRIRVPGGVLSAEQVQAVGEISRRFGRDVCDVTDRQNFQLHWIRIEDVPDIWARLAAVGLTTTQACGDVPRNVLGCPLAGIAAGEVLDATPHVLAVSARLVGTKEFSNLPRKYKVSISGCREQCAVHEVMDVGMAGVELDDGRRGYDLWVGGGLGTAPMFARRLGAFVPPERVEGVCVAVTSLFRDHGYRRSRTKARLKFLMKDWGPERLRQVLEREYLSAPLEDGPAGGGAGAGPRARPGRPLPPPPTRTATTWASPRRRMDARLWDWRRWPGGSPAPSYRRSPRWLAGTAGVGCGPPPSRRW